MATGNINLAVVIVVTMAKIQHLEGEIKFLCGRVADTVHLFKTHSSKLLVIKSLMV